MKKKKFIKLLLYISILLLCCSSGCAGDEELTQEPNPTVNTPLSNLFIQNLIPDKMPSGDSTFRVVVTSEHINIDSLPITLQISVYQTQTCVARTIERKINGHDDITTSFEFNTANFEGCNYQNTVYKIVLKSEDYPNASDSTYYVRGNPTIFTKYVDVEKAAMPEINHDMRDSIISGIVSTI